MRAIKTLLIGGWVVALAVGALGVPAAAADTKGTLAIVNGIPGQRVDVCLNGHELKSRLPYGGRVYRNVVATGANVLKVFKADQRTCRGTLLAMKSFGIGAADDFTIVATKKAPKVVIFDNANLGELPPLGAPNTFSLIAIRHAAELPVNVKIRFWKPEIDEFPLAPAADPIWTKGSSSLGGSSLPEYIYQVRATLPESPDTIAGPVRTYLVASHRYEWILLGTRHTNARFVVLDRVVSLPTP